MARFTPLLTHLTPTLASALLLLALVTSLGGCARTQQAPLVPADTPDVALAQQLDSIFDDADFANAFWGVRIERMDGSLIYERNSGKSFVPASNMKLVTTAAAMELLGPDYTYTTRLELAGTVTDGVLDGDVVIVGSGDPSLGTWRIEGRPDGDALLKGWVERIKARGINEINGSVIADGRVYTEEYFSGDWEFSDLPYWYAAGISGVNFSENVFRFTTAPGARIGDPAILSFIPETRYITVINDTLTTGTGGAKDADIVHRDPESNVILFARTIPIDEKPFEQRGSVWDGELYAATLFVEALERGGVKIVGGPASIRHIKEHDRLAKLESAPRQVLDTVTSPPVKELIRIINKPSHNFYADALFRTMGVAKKGKGDFATGSAVVKDWLKEIGVPTLERFDILDGSGLARRDWVTPQQFCALLRYMATRGETGRLYKESLPIAGVDSLTREGWKAPELQKNLHAKTGFIGNVRSLSGYINTADGEPLVLSMIGNSLMVPTKRSDKAIDAACLLLAQSNLKEPAR